MALTRRQESCMTQHIAQDRRPLSTSWGATLLAVRERMGATRQDLAGLLGVAVSTVQRLEMHSTYVGRQSLLRLILEYIADSRYVSAAEWQVLTSPLPPHARPPLRTATGPDPALHDSAENAQTHLSVAVGALVGRIGVSGSARVLSALAAAIGDCLDPAHVPRRTIGTKIDTGGVTHRPGTPLLTRAQIIGDRSVAVYEPRQGDSDDSHAAPKPPLVPRRKSV